VPDIVIVSPWLHKPSPPQFADIETEVREQGAVTEATLNDMI
jgi:hypothetical protein